VDVISREQWDLELCPTRDGDFHDPEAESFGDWWTPESVEVYVRCKCCGAKGITVLDLRLRKIKPRESD